MQNDSQHAGASKYSLVSRNYFPVQVKKSETTFYLPVQVTKATLCVTLQSLLECLEHKALQVRGLDSRISCLPWHVELPVHFEGQTPLCNLNKSVC